MPENEKISLTPEEEKEARDSYEKFLNVAGMHLDEITMILRAHLLAEYYLDYAIIKHIPRGDILVDNRLSFTQKIAVVESLDILSREFIDSIRNLNAIRNRCAHTLDYKITETDIDKIGRPFGKNYLDIKQKHSKNLKELLHWTLGRLLAPLSNITRQ